uniref:Uncharacterized protein n=1 Tax=Auxenochlorella protothecoides TaxID=3075 RepID=A0A1D2A1Y7_AUXPR
MACTPRRGHRATDSSPFLAPCTRPRRLPAVFRAVSIPPHTLSPLNPPPVLRVGAWGGCRGQTADPARPWNPRVELSTCAPPPCPHLGVPPHRSVQHPITFSTLASGGVRRAPPICRLPLTAPLRRRGAARRTCAPQTFSWPRLICRAALPWGWAHSPPSAAASLLPGAGVGNPPTPRTLPSTVRRDTPLPPLPAVASRQAPGGCTWCGAVGMLAPAISASFPGLCHATRRAHGNPTSDQLWTAHGSPRLSTCTLTLQCPTLPIRSLAAGLTSLPSTRHQNGTFPWAPKHAHPCWQLMCL